MYKCKVCGRRFSGGGRRDKSQVITDYIEGKQTVAQLAVKYGVSEKNHPSRSEGNALCAENLQRQACHHSDGYDLLGAWIWSYGHKGCPKEEGSMAEICES